MSSMENARTAFLDAHLNLSVDGLVDGLVLAYILIKEVRPGRAAGRRIDHGCNSLVGDIADGVGCRGIAAAIPIVTGPGGGRTVEVRFNIGNRHDGFLLWRPFRPQAVSVGPMAEHELSRDAWNVVPKDHLSNPFTIDIEGNLVSSPVEAIVVERFISTEGHLNDLVQGSVGGVTSGGKGLW